MNLSGYLGLAHKKTVAEVLKRGANNFDLFRLIAALIVIYGHSFSTGPDSSRIPDFLLLGAGYNSAGIAVKFFFFLSGILVADSLLNKRSILQFLFARFFRIWPALIFLVLITVFVVGPLVTNNPVSSYFLNPETYSYIKHQLLMQTWGNSGIGYTALPGVFDFNKYPSLINASLWTLPAEVGCYLFLLGAFTFGLLNKKFTFFFLILIVLDSLLSSRIIFLNLPINNEDFSYLPFCFSIGVLIAVYKEKVSISLNTVIGCLLFYYFFRNTFYERFFFYLLVFLGIFYIASLDWIITKFKLPFDISYGVYLWGFIIQQILAFEFPGVVGTPHFLMSAAVSIIMGLISWFLIEKNSIKFGKKLLDYIITYEKKIY